MTGRPRPLLCRISPFRDCTWRTHNAVHCRNPARLDEWARTMRGWSRPPNSSTPMSLATTALLSNASGIAISDFAELDLRGGSRASGHGEMKRGSAKMAQPEQNEASSSGRPRACRLANKVDLAAGLTPAHALGVSSHACGVPVRAAGLPTPNAAFEAAHGAHTFPRQPTIQPTLGMPEQTCLIGRRLKPAALHQPLTIDYIAISELTPCPSAPERLHGNLG